MTLSIFTQKLGDTEVVWPHDSDDAAELARNLLDAVQTVVDVLVDEGISYTASFADGDSAYTDHQHRRIVISAKPMMDGGHRIDDVAAIMTGFAVHEIGHTKEREREFTTALRAEWGDKVSPKRLANILSDVRLEASMIARFAGLRDVFIPTLNWVAEKTCPDFEVAYGKTLHDRLNFVGQVVRYAPFTQFATDAASLREYKWWEDWGRVDHTTDNETMLRLVREGIAHIREGAEYEPEPPAQDEEPPVITCPIGPSGTEEEGEPQEGNPDNDFPEGEDGDDEPGDEPGDGDTEGEDSDEDGEDGDGEADGEDADSDEDGEGEGEGEGEDGDDTTDGGDNGEDGDGDTEGGDKPGTDEDGEADHIRDGQLDEGETLDRTEHDGPMGDGAGGSGKAIADSDDIDEGLLEEKLNKTQDELTEGEGWSEQYQREHIQRLVDEERVSSRLDAGIHGKMKVRVHL